MCAAQLKPRSPTADDKQKLETRGPTHLQLTMLAHVEFMEGDR